MRDTNLPVRLMDLTLKTGVVDERPDRFDKKTHIQCWTKRLALRENQPMRHS